MSQPIRLIQRNGKTINLDATKFGMSIGRGVAGIPVPILGERFGADLNIVSVKLNMDGIIRDDDCESTDVKPTQSASFIDFSRPNVRSNTGAGETWLTEDGGTVAIADIVNKPFYLRSTYQQSLGDGSRITFKFVNTGAGNTYSGGVVSIDLDLSTNNYATIIAAGATSRASWLAGLLNTTLGNTANNIGIVITSSAHTSPSSQRLGHAFTSALEAGMIASLGNCRVGITQQEKGKNGDSSTPTFWSIISDTSGEENQLTIQPPAFQTFRGGANNTCRSAGDKIQDLIANTANSNIMGAVGEMFQLGTNDENKSLELDFNS